MSRLRRFLDRILRRSVGERLLYVTDRAPFQSPDRGVGEVILHEGGVYEITRYVRGPKTYLARGGSVVQWEVWGRPAPEERLSESVAEEAERILSESDAASERRRNGDEDEDGPGEPQS